MSYKTFALLFVFCALASVAFCDEGLNEQFAESQDEGQNFGNDFSQGITPEQQEQFMEMQRTKLWGCYFLTKNRLISKADAISKVVTGANSEALFKRMTTDVMKTCLERIQPEESQKVIQSLGSQEFNINDWDYIHNFNVERYAGEDVKLELDAEESYVYDYYQKLDENIREHYEEQAEKDDQERRRNVDYEPRIGGLSLKETSPFVKALYALGVGVGITAVFLFAYKTLFRNEETPYEKAKRLRDQKKKAKAQ